MRKLLTSYCLPPSHRPAASPLSTVHRPQGPAPWLPRGSCAKPGTMGSDLGQPGSGLPSRLCLPCRARPGAEHGHTAQPSQQNNAPTRQAKAVRGLAAAFHPQLGQIRRNSARVKGEAMIHSSRGSGQECQHHDNSVMFSLCIVFFQILKKLSRNYSHIP